MKQARLCYNCAKKGHVSRFCFAKSACSVPGCNRRHHSLLHTEQRDLAPAPAISNSSQQSSRSPQQSSSGFTAATVTNSVCDVCLNVVPVKVTAGSETVFAYAFLDQGSTTSLCDKRLLDSLKITGELTEFSVTTVNEQASPRRGTKVNLTLTSLTGENSVFLQDVLSIDRLPVVPNPRLTKEELDAWPHLRDLTFPNIAAEVLLLIGVTSPEAFWVTEERRGNRGEPYAVQTTLG